MSDVQLDEALEADPNVDLNPFESELTSKQQLAVQSLHWVELRKLEIQRMEASVRELCQMMVELGHLVSHQGETIDNIEAQVWNTSANTEKGKKNLVGAVQKVRRSRRCRCVCCILVIVVLLLIGAAIAGAVLFSKYGSKLGL
jgi:t-SNARE complex subunit (syntaxin)